MLSNRETSVFGATQSSFRAGSPEKPRPEAIKQMASAVEGFYSIKTNMLTKMKRWQKPVTREEFRIDSLAPPSHRAKALPAPKVGPILEIFD